MEIAGETNIMSSCACFVEKHPFVDNGEKENDLST